MEKKLPEMFVNKVETTGNNNKVFYSSKNEERTVEIAEEKENSVGREKNINQKINEIFNSRDYVYKADVILTVRGENVTKRIVGKNSMHLITIDNELIPISDITDIKRK